MLLPPDERTVLAEDIAKQLMSVSVGGVEENQILVQADRMALMKTLRIGGGEKALGGRNLQSVVDVIYAHLGRLEVIVK